MPFYVFPYNLEVFHVNPLFSLPISNVSCYMPQFSIPSLMVTPVLSIPCFVNDNCLSTPVALNCWFFVNTASYQFIVLDLLVISDTMVALICLCYINIKSHIIPLSLCTSQSRNAVLR